jgi:hypothetical protein
VVRRAREFAHLPTGREPGAQTLRNVRNRPWLEGFVGFVGTAMALTGLFVALGGRGDEFDAGEEAIGGAMFGLIGAVCAGWAYSMWRRRRPAKLPVNLPGVDLAVEGADPRRGDELTVTLSLGLGAAADEGDRFEVGLVCVERYDRKVKSRHRGGTTTIRLSQDATAYEDWRPVTPAPGSQTFRFAIPQAAPYSYEGDCVSYCWRVSARVARPLRADPRHDQPIWVQP